MIGKVNDDFYKESMMGILHKLGFLSMPSTNDGEKTKEDIKKEYAYWRLRTFYSMYMGYAFFYLSRKSFTFAMPLMISDLGFTKTDLGILGSILYFSYGISKFLSGIISDRSNPRYFMAFGLMATGVWNIFFGLSSSILCFAIFWGLNGIFQGWGWPPCAKLLTHWYAKEERGRWWGLWNTSHNLGGAIIPLIVAVIASSYGWRMAMYFPGVICILMGFVLLNRLRDTPKSLGLPSIEEFKGSDYAEDNKYNDKMTKKQLLLDLVLRNKYIWILGFAYFFVYVVRTAVNDWGQLYLYETRGFTLLEAGTCVFAFEAGGFLGSLSAGWISDKVFAGRRGPVNALFTFGVVCCLWGMWLIPDGGFYLANTLFFWIGFFIFGPQMMIGIAAAELSHKKAAGAATGFAGCFAYIGAAAAGYPFGKITQEYGWGMYFLLLLICGACALLLLSLVLSPEKKKAEAKT